MNRSYDYLVRAGYTDDQIFGIVSGAITVTDAEIAARLAALNGSPPAPIDTPPPLPGDGAGSNPPPPPTDTSLIPPPPPAGLPPLPDPYSWTYLPDQDTIFALLDAGYSQDAVNAWLATIEAHLTVPATGGGGSGGGGGGVGGDGEEPDLLDPQNDPEPGPEPTDIDYLTWGISFDQAPGSNSTAPGHQPAGTVLVSPYQGNHARAFNRAHGEDTWQWENAVTIWVPPGAGALAVAPGVISPGGRGYGLLKGNGLYSGFRLHLVCDDGRIFFYAHLQPGHVLPKNTRVAKGQLIGTTGISNGVPNLLFAAKPPVSVMQLLAAAYTPQVYDFTPGDGGGGATNGTTTPSQLADVEHAWHTLVNVLGGTLPTAADHIRDARTRAANAVR